MKLCCKIGIKEFTKKTQNKLIPRKTPENISVVQTERKQHLPPNLFLLSEFKSDVITNQHKWGPIPHGTELL